MKTKRTSLLIDDVIQQLVSFDSFSHFDLCCSYLPLNVLLLLRKRSVRSIEFLSIILFVGVICIATGRRHRSDFLSSVSHHWQKTWPTNQTTETSTTQLRLVGGQLWFSRRTFPRHGCTKQQSLCWSSPVQPVQRLARESKRLEHRLFVQRRSCHRPHLNFLLSSRFVFSLLDFVSTENIWKDQSLMLDRGLRFFVFFSIEKQCKATNETLFEKEKHAETTLFNWLVFSSNSSDQITRFTHFSFVSSSSWRQAVPLEWTLTHTHTNIGRFILDSLSPSITPIEETDN